VLVRDPRVANCAAIGVPDEVKGETIWCFVVLAELSEADVEQDLRSLVAQRLGAAFAPERVIAVSDLPRTRSAKIVRRAVRAAVTGEEVGDVSSLENPEAIGEIRRAVSGGASAPAR
jgi:acetyl-CoA synthetase